MKRFTRRIVLWTAFALFPAAVQGQWIDDYQGVLQDGETYTLDYQNPGYNVVSSRTFSGNRVYVGPYEGRNAAGDHMADGWYVLTSNDGRNRQEMLVRTRTVTVPEPSTYLLMATGLFFLAVLGRKRRDQVEA